LAFYFQILIIIKRILGKPKDRRFTYCRAASLQPQNTHAQTANPWLVKTLLHHYGKQTGLV